MSDQSILIQWNVTVSDTRRLKGFIISYAKVHDQFVVDQNDVDFMYSYESNLKKSSSGFDLNAEAPVRIEWNYLYAEYDEDSSLEFRVQIKNVDPFTKYAIYVKADLTSFESTTPQHLKTNILSFDRLISNINYIYSLPARKYLLLLLLLLFQYFIK